MEISYRGRLCKTYFICPKFCSPLLSFSPTKPSKEFIEL